MPPLPWLVARSRLQVLFLAIVIIITDSLVGHSSKTIQIPRVVGHLQLKVLDQPYQLLMLLDSGLQFEDIRVSD